MTDDKAALDLLFGEATTAKQSFDELKLQTDPEYEPISEKTLEDKTVIETIQEKIEQFKEHNGLSEDPEEQLISNKNSERALPDELSSQDGVPISTAATEGIHVADENVELISTHNSERALPEVEKPLTNSEEIDVISSVNSSKFVP